jgi:hypothetical protein
MTTAAQRHNARQDKIWERCLALKRQAAEQATGCNQNPATPEGGQLWVSTHNGEGRKVSDSEARRLFREGNEIEAPNAGAGSYITILERLGFTAVEVEDHTSSAGDWTFKVPSGLVFQRNRYPHCGFAYQYQRDAHLRTSV